MIIKISNEEFREWRASGGVSVRDDLLKHRYSPIRTRLAERLVGEKIQQGRGKKLPLVKAAQMIGVASKTLHRWRRLGLVPRKFTMLTVKQILAISSKPV